MTRSRARRSEQNKPTANTLRESYEEQIVELKAQGEIGSAARLVNYTGCNDCMSGVVEQGWPHPDSPQGFYRSWVISRA